MDLSSAVHPTDQTLLAYGLGKLDPSTSASVDEHLETCPECRRRVGELSGNGPLGRHCEAHGPAVGAGECSATIATWGAGPASPRAEALAPELVDHPDYEIVRELGRGGMGVVYLARNKLMGRLEVLKVVSHELVERTGVLDRFLREIRSAAQLHHTNIVSAHSAMRLGKSVVLAMEYVEGDDLAKLVKSGGPLPVANACYFIYQAALGLQHAHEHGMVHRDIKPANLMLARDGRKATVKVLDFGLAKVTSETPVDSGLTQEGQIIGTPDYIAPEQTLDAHKADIRADIYSLGCTFYYLLTGRAPFQSKSVFEVLQAHQSMDAKPLNLIRPDVPVELAAVVAKMLAKDPGQRYQTPGALAKELLPFFKSTAHQTAVPRAELPGVSPPATASQPASFGAVPPPPATEVADPTRPVAPKANPEGVAWERLIELKEMEEPVAASAATSGSSRRRPPSKWRTTAAVAGCGAVLLGTIITITTNEGRGKIETTDPSAIPKDTSDSKASGPRSPTPKESTLKGLPGSLDPAGASNGALKTITNSIGLKLVSIPAGGFLMGSSGDDKEAQVNEKPQHRIRITRPFYLGGTEVTVGQFRAVVEKTGYLTEAEQDGKGGIGRSKEGKWERRSSLIWRSPGFDQTDTDPVVHVSWNDAVAFCNQLSELEGREPYYDQSGERTRSVGDGYRLPTEAEWEYACRARTSARYSFGDDAARFGHYGWSVGNAGLKTHPVGLKHPNAFDLFDMHGNVWEWCWDGYDKDYYRKSPGADPSGPPDAADRVARGGGWDYLPSLARSADRNGYAPAYRSSFLGFRVARSQSEH